MFFKWFKKIVDNIKDVNEIGLFSIMSDADLMNIFKYTPMYFIMLPMLGLLFTVSAFIKGYEFAKASNKNIDQWLGLVVSALCAALTSISLFGSVLATSYGLEFALGPWFFLASITVALTHQVIMLAINGYRAYESLSHSSQRMHYVQAALNNVFYLGLTAAITGAVIFVMLTPVAPAIGATCALTALALTAVNAFWKMLPADGKRAIKNQVALGKPQFNENEALDLSSDRVHNSLTVAPEHHYQRMFTRKDHRAALRSMSFNEGLNYLQNEIQRKIECFTELSLVHSDKNRQKKALLVELLHSLNGDRAFSKEHLLEQHPLAFQNFCAEQGEVEQLVDAAELLKNRSEVLAIDESDTFRSYASV